MANEQNLRPSEYKLSQEEAKKGGIASGQARRRKKELREALEMLLEKDYTDKSGEKIQGIDVIATALFKEASKGNVRAFNSLRDTIGQMPIQKIQVSEVDPNIIDEVERMVTNDEE